MLSSLRLFRYLEPYWVWALLAPLFMVLEVGMDLLQPRFIQRIVDDGVARADFNVVTATGATMVVVAVIGLIGGMGCAIFAIKAGQAFGADLRADVFRKVQSLSFANLDKVETGGLITRLTNDVTQVTEMVMMLMRIMVRVPLLLFGSLILAVLTSPSLSVLFVGLIPVVVVILAIIIRKTFPLFSRVQTRLDALNTVLQENLAGVRVVKAFARAAHELSRFGRANDALMTQNITAVRTSTITMPLMMLTVNTGLIAALWLGGNLISTGDMHVGQLIAFINYLIQALHSLMQVSMLMIQLSRAQASMQRVSEVLDSTPAIQNKPDAQPLPKTTKAALTFENVSFGYNDTSREPVLKNISFEAEPGQTVAILGATGAGKSTLVQLVPRYYDVADGHGRILLDGTDIRLLREEELRKSVGMALQESILFSGSIRDNIKYGRPEASNDDVLAAAKAAQADEFIQKLPDGYDTQLGQRGVNLSGGQKQRIAIARALLPQPSILILDDSTSAVDVRTEAEIQRALQEQAKPQTRFIVAQRISSVVNADKILVLDNGTIAAEGTHDELMQRSPIYREIYDSQMQNGVIDQSAE